MTQASFAAALLEPRFPCPAGLRAWNGSDPVARFAVHRNNVVSSLIDALADTFPVTQDLVGNEFFRAMASVFVRQHPPRSSVLAHYGDGFADFIDRFEPARPVPYLADVARLEKTRVHAYHAADADPLAAQAVSAALSGADDAGDLMLKCHPSASVVISDFAIVSLWAAHQGDGELSAVDPALPESALVVRHELEVLVLRLPPGVADFIAALRNGKRLAAAAALASAQARDFDLPSALALLMRHGALTSLHSSRRVLP